MVWRALGEPYMSVISDTMILRYYGTMVSRHHGSMGSWCHFRWTVAGGSSEDSRTVNRAPNHTKEGKSRLEGPGIRAFFRIAELWQLSVAEQMDLLGLRSRSTLYAWKRAQDARLDQDQLERLSHVLSIYSSLGTLLPVAEAAYTWVKRPNNAPPFMGRPALDLMRQGALGLKTVRAYLETQ